jgi:hypothetical protein
MTELTPEENAEFLKCLKGPTLWTRVKNKWKNLSRFWSARERNLQRAVNRLHNDIHTNLTKFGE